jgi:threonine-phosphate decarboxylase
MRNPPEKELVHRHGGIPEHDFRRLNIKPRQVVDFSVNVNPLGPPSEITEGWSKLVGEIVHYPRIDALGVASFYRKKFHLPPNCVLPGNGAIESIYLVPRAFGFKRTAVISPSFHDYIRAARLAGSEVSLIPLSRDRNFEPPTLNDLKSRIAGTDAVFFGNPNNPTGTVFPGQMILSLAEAYPEKYFLVDEAFVQFVDGYEKITLMARRHLRPNVLAFHSLTKFYCLPGLRLGAVIGHPETLSRLRAFKEPWTVNAVAEKAASLLSSCRNFENKTRLFISQERHRLYERLRKTSGIRVFIPSANFFLIRWTATSNLDDLLRALLSRGLYVRDCRNFPGLEDNFFRFAIRHPAENDCLVDTIAAEAEGPNG